MCDMAMEVDAPTRTRLLVRPVSFDGIRQRWLRELTTEFDAAINGVRVRLPAGTVIGVTSFGSAGLGCRLFHDVAFRARTGRVAVARRSVHQSALAAMAAADRRTARG